MGNSTSQVTWACDGTCDSCPSLILHTHLSHQSALLVSSTYLWKFLAPGFATTVVSSAQPLLCAKTSPALPPSFTLLWFQSFLVPQKRHSAPRSQLPCHLSLFRLHLVLVQSFQGHFKISPPQRASPSVNSTWVAAAPMFNLVIRGVSKTSQRAPCILNQPRQVYRGDVPV